MQEPIRIAEKFDQSARAVVFEGSCLDLLENVPNDSLQLVVTSPPYNIGKPYETRLSLDDYIGQQQEVIHECVRALKPEGSICWQVGNYVQSGEIIPLDTMSLGSARFGRTILHETLPDHPNQSRSLLGQESPPQHAG